MFLEFSKSTFLLLIVFYSPSLYALDCVPLKPAGEHIEEYDTGVKGGAKTLFKLGKADVNVGYKSKERRA